jgi:hypothetical protein
MYMTFIAKFTLLLMPSSENVVTVSTDRKKGADSE